MNAALATQSTFRPKIGKLPTLPPMELVQPRSAQIISIRRNSRWDGAFLLWVLALVLLLALVLSFLFRIPTHPVKPIPMDVTTAQQAVAPVEAKSVTIEKGSEQLVGQIAHIQPIAETKTMSFENGHPVIDKSDRERLLSIISSY